MANHHMVGGFCVRTPPHHICGVTSRLMFPMIMFLLLLVFFRKGQKVVDESIKDIARIFVPPSM